MLNLSLDRVDVVVLTEGLLGYWRNGTENGVGELSTFQNL